MRLPADVGFTETEKLPACPAETAMGMDMPDAANCALEKVVCVMFSALLPVLVTETDCELDLPTVTLPKLTAAGATWNVMADDYWDLYTLLLR